MSRKPEDKVRRREFEGNDKHSSNSINNTTSNKTKSRFENNGTDYDRKIDDHNKEPKVVPKERRAEIQDKVIIDIRKSSSTSRTPSPFLKPYERKDYVAPQPINKKESKKQQESSSDSDDEEQARKKAKSSSNDKKRDESSSRKLQDAKKDEVSAAKLSKVDKISKTKAENDRPIKSKDENDSNSESEKSRKRKKKHQDGSSSEESEVEKKKKRSKKHKKHSKKKSKKKSVSVEKSSESEQETSNVNEDLEKKLRQKALVSLMRNNKKSE